MSFVLGNDFGTTYIYEQSLIAIAEVQVIRYIVTLTFDISISLTGTPQNSHHISLPNTQHCFKLLMNGYFCS